MVKILIAEDDIVIASDLKISLKNLGYEVLNIAKNAAELMENLENLIPDIILLDINLEGETDGIQIAQKINEAFEIPFIFMTALNNPETLERAKLTEPEAYLVKPVRIEDLQRNIEIAVFKSEKKQRQKAEDEKKSKQIIAEKGILMSQSLFIKVKNRLEKLDLKSVLWIEAKDIYSVIKTEKSQYIASHSLKELETIFPDDQFLRVHRSYIIAFNKIEALEDNNLLIANQYIPIGKTYKEMLLKRFRIL